MSATVHLEQRVIDKLPDSDLKDRLRRELGKVFPQAQLVTVRDLIVGFTRDYLRKMVLAVEVQRAPAKRTGRGVLQSPQFRTHIVKLGLPRLHTLES